MTKKGLIIKAISGEYVVLANDLEYTCKPLGIMRFKSITPRVGDLCTIEESDGTYVISDIEKRKNELLRPIVANVDKVVIVTSLTRPDLNLNLLDRLICQVEWTDINIVLVFSKADLVNMNDFEGIIDYYKKLGYPTYVTPFALDNLKEEFKNCICVLAGQSGTGKSSIINAIDASFNLKTDDISDALGRGKHTTRHTELLKVYDGWVADTPGFGALDLEMDEVSLGQTFKEFFALKCKYNPCYHINEPACKVKEAVDKGEILKSRYENYLSFLQEIKEAKQKNIYKQTKDKKK